VSGSLAVRENEISKETDIRQVGAICLSCGDRQNELPEPGITLQFPPVEWKSATLTDGSHLAAAFEGMLSRANRDDSVHNDPVSDGRQPSMMTILMSDNSNQATALIEELLILNRAEHVPVAHPPSSEEVTRRLSNRRRVRQELVQALALSF
jgi:hypothetical protein